MDKKTTISIVLIAVAIVAALLVFGKKPTSDSNPNGEQQETAVNPCGNSPTKEVVMTASSDLGNYLADSKCMTLYVTSNDKNGQSSCNDACAAIWKPFAYDQKDLKSLSGDLYRRLNIIKRKDGSYQYAYGNTPLYYFTKDSIPGDMKGHGAEGVWSVILLDKQGTK
jgi:predicted lipoprotein with Yx(FWY)xxD motif